MDNSTYDDLVILKLLLSTEGFGNKKILNIIQKTKALNNIFHLNLNQISSIDGIGDYSAKSLIKSFDKIAKIKNSVDEELEYLKKLNAKVITIFDDKYPYLLKEIYDPPLILYYKGNPGLFDLDSIAIVGTRNPTNYGKIQAERFSKEFAAKGICVISGMARGIDSVAHNSIISCSGITIAVIGSGLDVIYPPENKKLFEKICEDGAVISEYPPGTKPDAPNFPKRNRIISGMSLGTLIIETKLNGGAMLTAAFALDHNREVFAVPGNLGINQSEGTNKLIQQGNAKLVRNVEDVLEELSLKVNAKKGAKKEKLEIALNLFEEKIYNTLNSEPIHVDKIAELTNINISDCLVYLLSLEFKGLVKQLPGKMFVKV